MFNQLKKYRSILFVAILNSVWLFLGNSLQSLELSSGMRGFFAFQDIVAPPTPPKGIVIIEIDQNSFLSIPEVRDCIRHYHGAINIRCFSRSLHGDLARKLSKAGAKLTVFNLLFREARGDEDDYFADAIRDAGNVVLQDFQERRFIGTGVEIVDVDPPVAPLRDWALSAPFPLPDSGGGILPNIWLSLDLIHVDDTSAQNVSYPVLPVLVLHALVLGQYWPQFVSVISEVSTDFASSSPAPHQRTGLNLLINRLASEFRNRPAIARELENILQRRIDLSEACKRALSALFHTHAMVYPIYANPYAPPNTITAIGYHEVDSALAANPSLFRDQVVFVGASAAFGRATKGGTIDTPHGKYSSTELLATIFANLRDKNTLHSVGNKIALAVPLAWWLLLNLIQIKLDTRTTIAVISVLTLFYMSLVYYMLAVYNGLIPWLAILLQSLLSIGVAGIRHYKMQRKKLANILHSNLPEELVSVFSRNDFESIRQGTYHQGVCLAADGEGYTKLGASRGEKWLADFMLAYQPVVEECMRKYHGAVKDWAGDGMVALWVEKPKCKVSGGLGYIFRRPAADADIRNSALNAALSLTELSERFCESWGVKFPLRIGITYGPMWLSFVDELKAFGDTINSASRIETLNKETNTRILVHEDMLLGQSDFVSRRIGQFVLRGHSQAISIYEIMCLKNKASADILELVERFQFGLARYEARQWQEAEKIFSEILAQYPDDGPSQYYFLQCRDN